MLRPVRLQRINAEPEDDSTEKTEGLTYSVEPEEKKAPSSGVLRAISHTLEPLAPVREDVTVPLGEEGARHLLRRTPNSYLLNQAYSLWVYVSLFLLTILLTHKLSVNDY